MVVDQSYLRQAFSETNRPTKFEIHTATVHRSGTDAFSLQKRGDTALGDWHSNHDVPMKIGLFPCLTSERLVHTRPASAFQLMNLYSRGVVRIVS